MKREIFLFAPLIAAMLGCDTCGDPAKNPELTKITGGTAIVTATTTAPVPPPKKKLQRPAGSGLWSIEQSNALLGLCTRSVEPSLHITRATRPKNVSPSVRGPSAPSPLYQTSSTVQGAARLTLDEALASAGAPRVECVKSTGLTRHPLLPGAFSPSRARFVPLRR